MKWNARADGQPIKNSRDKSDQAMVLFTDMYARDKNLKQVTMEAITT